MKKISSSIILPTALFINTAVGDVAYNIETAKAHQEEIKEEKLHEIEFKEVDRVEILEDFLEKYDSPLVENAETFVEVADKYGMDYRLLPAISCMESTCGNNLIPEYHNPFGWGVYGSNHMGFENYDEAIEVVGKGISENYIAKGFDTVDKIAPIYTPPNSYNWMSGVSFFISQIDDVVEGI